MEKPVISLICSAIRTKLWLGFYGRLTDNETPFEIVFIGPKKPDFQLPENFRYIQSDVKPEQCLEAASRMAEGEYLLPAPDDVVYSDHALDRLLAAFLKAKNDLVVISMINRKAQMRSKEHRFIPSDPTSPRMPFFGGMVKKSVWRGLGGLDNRFVSSHGGTDMTLRILEQGGSVVYAEDVFIDEIVKSGPRLWMTYGRKFDHPFMMRLWSTRSWKHGFRRRFSKVRRDILHPYKDDRILDASQGFTGSWRGK